ncbi:MAG TPA: hypothetical protein VGY56_17080 [Verrucomicrobiae bacterium]|nr:hypothetical protein [Verrucomicrobiae bacterium]
MKLLTSTAALFVGAILASPSAFGQTYSSTPNDLLFGFQNQAGGGSEDYIINLGSAASLIDSGTVVNLSGDFSMSDFNAVLGSSSSMYGGVIGAANTSSSGTPNTADVFLTELRIGGAGVSTVAGSGQPSGLTRNADNTAYSQLGTLYSPAAGTGGLDTGKTWESLVDPANNTGSFYSNTGVNPDTSVSTSSVLYEDLWGTSSSSFTGAQPFVYEGYFTLDLTGASPDLTFTPVPEPSGYLISSLGGILMLMLRFRPGRRNA